MSRKTKSDGEISICGHDYTLRYVKGLRGDEGQSLWGWYRVGSREVMLDADMDNRNSRTTLIHEIVHGILEHTGHGNGEHVEGICDAVAYGLESVRINGKPILR